MRFFLYNKSKIIPSMSTKYNLKYLDINQLEPDLIDVIEKAAYVLKKAFNDPKYEDIKYFNLEDLYGDISDREALIDYFEVQNNTFSVNSKLIKDKISEAKRKEILNRVIPIPDKPIFLPFTDKTYITLFNGNIVFYSLDEYEMFNIVSNPVTLEPLETHMKFWVVSPFLQYKNEKELLNSNYKDFKYEHLDVVGNRHNTEALFFDKKSWKYEFNKIIYNWKHIKNEYYLVSYKDTRGTKGKLFMAIAKCLNGCYLDILDGDSLNVFSKYKWWLDQFDLEYLRGPNHYYIQMCINELALELSKLTVKPHSIVKYVDPVSFVKDVFNNNPNKLSDNTRKFLEQVDDNNYYYSTPDNIPGLSEGHYVGIALK